MVKQGDIVNPKSLEDCASHGNTDDEFEEYSEEEMFSEEESNENLHMLAKKEVSCEKLNEVEGSYAEETNEDSLSDEESAEEVPCGDESDGEDSCPEEPNEEDIDEEPEAASAEYPTEGTALEEASDEDPSDVSFEEIIEEEFYEDSDEEPNGGEPLTGSMDQIPLVIDSDGVPSLLEENKASDHICSKSKTSAESSSHQCLKESSNLFTDAVVSKQPDDPLASSKKRRSRWDIKAEAPMLVDESCGLDKKRKTRWSSDAKAEAPIPSNDNADLNKRRKTRWSSDKTQLNMSTILKLPDFVKNILSDTSNDQRIQRLNAELQEINQKLEGSVIVNEEPQEEIFPSTQPIFVGLDSSVHTREVRIRLKLLMQKQKIITELLTMSEKKDKPKICSKHNYIFSKKLYVPFKEYPNYNFVGLILGPNGNTLKKMEKETGTSIRLRGKGSTFRDKKTRDGHDEMHVFIQSDSQTGLDAAVSMVEKLLVPVDDRHNHHKFAQLRELAEIRRNLKEGNLLEMELCDICGISSHPTSDCPLIATTSKANANLHAGSGSLFSSFKSPSLSIPALPIVAQSYGDKPIKESDPANLFVGYLPQSVSTDKLKELFLPYGSICEAKVMTDLSTGQSKRSGFVKYTTASDAAKAIEKMNGYLIDGKRLAVRIAGTSSSNANLPNYPGFVSTPPPSLNANLPNYPGFVSTPPPSLNANLPNFPGLTSIPPPSSNANLPNYLGNLPSTSIANLPNYPVSASIPSTSSANLVNYPVLASIPTISNANLPNYPDLDGIPQEIHKPDCWPGPPGSMLPESGFSSIKSNYNSLTFTGSLPLQSSTSLASSFQSTSLGKYGYMMDEKKLNATITATHPPSLSSNRPGFAAISLDIPEPNCWPGPPGSRLPESDTYFSKSSYNSLKHNEIAPFRSSTYLCSTSQTSMSSSQFPVITATSNELASFPGYLKSFDPPDQLDQSMPSSSLSSRTLHFIGSFSGKQMKPTWR